MASQAREASGDRPVATNRRARHEYEILETVEAGLVLRGTEVKSLRAGLVNFKDSYASVRNGEGWLLGCHISPYSHGTDANHEPERDRKLLLHKRELSRLSGKISERQAASRGFSPLVNKRERYSCQHTASPGGLTPASVRRLEPSGTGNGRHILVAGSEPGLRGGARLLRLAAR